MKKVQLIIVLLAALKFALPFLLQNHVYELHRDEYLYYAQAQHLDVGFLECPPLLAFLGSISSALGGSAFWIKFWPAIFGALLLVLTTRIAKELGGGLFAQIIAALAILFSAFLRTNFLFQPNFLEHFFWTLAAYYIVRCIHTKQSKYFYLLALALALGWWSKYSVLFFVAAFFISLLLSPQRRWLLQKQFWFAAGLGMLLVIPNIIWQYNHKWPLAHHMAELRDTQLQYINRGDFLKEQLLMLFPVAFVWIGGLIWLLRNNKFRIVGLVFLSVIGLLMLGSGKGYYSLGAYPMLLAAGGVCYERLSLHRLWLRVAVVVLILVLSLPFTPLLLPMQAPQQMAETNRKWGLEKIGILKWEDQKSHPLQQDFADMLGWKELAQKAERAYNGLPTFSKAHTYIFCGSYGQAGAVSYYGRGNEFRQRALSDNGTFLLWIPRPLPFDNLIFIDDDAPEHALFQHFQKSTLLDSVTNPLSRQWGNKIYLFEQADSVAKRMLEDALQQERAAFIR